MEQNLFAEKVQHLRDTYHSGKTLPLEWRIGQLLALKRMFAERSAEYEAALWSDLHKNGFQTYATETGFLEREINHALECVEEWMQPLEVSTPIFLHPARSRVIYEPLGVALIMGAWNYPLQLTLGPLVAAIAAGNAAVIKAPRTAKATFQAVGRILPQYLDPDAFLVIDDDTPNEMILAEHWDKIFFTGSAPTGKIVMQAAVAHLTPVTLELGGKSPALVDNTANLRVAARRIAQGKLFNAGQTCVAPDYILAQEGIIEPLIAELVKVFKEFFGDDPKKSEDFCRIINPKQFDTLIGFLKDGVIVCGGEYDRESLYIAPTILKNVSPLSPVMQTEIFGPILPVLPVKDMDEALRFVQKREKPLAFYIFSEDRPTIERILLHSTSGGACVNEAINHVVVPGLPFGGVGNSGMGKYHGEWGFKEFSNARAVLDHGTSFDPDVRYPPYDAARIAKMKKMLTMHTPEAFDGVMRWLLGHFGDFILKFIK
jgi:aldehyde dehydrogenase (NAD+)